MSIYRTEQQKKRKQKAKRRSRARVTASQPASISSPSVVAPDSAPTSQQSQPAPVATPTPVASSSTVASPTPVASSSTVATTSAFSTPSATMSNLAKSVGQASAGVTPSAATPSSLYTAYLSELSAEGVTRQLLQHAQLSSTQVGQLKAHVALIRNNGVKQQAVWQLVIGGVLLALGILPQVIIFAIGNTYISLYQVALSALSLQFDQSGVLPAVLIALVQVLLIGGGATLTTLGVHNQAKHEAWKLSEDIASRV